MSIMFRWLFYGCLTRTLLAMSAMVAIYMIIEVFDKSRYLGQGFTAPLLLEYLMLKTPMIVSQFMPIILLLSIAIYIAEISHHLEIVAIRASGMAVTHIYMPIIGVAFIAAMSTFALNEWVTPVTNQRLDVMERVYVHHQPAVSSATEQWLKDDHRFIRLTPLTENQFAILMLETGIHGEWKRRLEAVNGIYREGQWYLSDIYISQPDRSEGFKITHQDAMIIPSLVGPDTAEVPSPSQMRLVELYRYGRHLKDAGLAASQYIFSFHQKIAAPFACLIMAILAVSLCMHMGSRISAASLGMGSAIIMGLLFYVFGLTSSMLAVGERLPAAYAAWMPNMIFIGIAGFFVLHKEGH
ncbi:MAG: LptF/LptG family permease [Zetaproteobacteria bacterium]|nr:LptF/LptG family permease [Zetaproteobacteria bacterium]